MRLRLVFRTSSSNRSFLRSSIEVSNSNRCGFSKSSWISETRLNLGGIGAGRILRGKLVVFLQDLVESGIVQGTELGEVVQDPHRLQKRPLQVARERRKAT